MKIKIPKMKKYTHDNNNSNKIIRMFTCKLRKRKTKTGSPKKNNSAVINIHNSVQESVILPSLQKNYYSGKLGEKIIIAQIDF